MALLIRNIGTLVNTRTGTELLRGSDMRELTCVEHAYLVIEGDRIAAYGKMKELEKTESFYDEVTDAAGRMVLPSWCDSHTHLVFAESREKEFVDKIRGLSYAEIAAKGGGILQSAAKLNQTAEDELFLSAWARLQELIALGTGAIEIKSGYGLTVEGEIKMLRVIRRLKEKAPIPVKATFLGAHAIPPAFKNNREAYISQVTDEMLPLIAAEKLADYIDVFCEEGFFSPEETISIGNAGKAAGLKVKLHANQLHVSGGVEAGITLGAVSVDHLESMDEKAIHSLSQSSTIGTLLPSAAFFLRMPFQPARKLIDAGCAIALASDFNPGSSPSGNMNLVVSMACIGMKMLPEESINAATINGAHAMEVQHLAGSITVGKKANLILTRPLPSLAYIPYAFGTNLIEKVMVNGEWI